MGAQQSKIRISIPKDTTCFPWFENDSEILEAVHRVKECHIQAIKLATWIGSFVAAPYSSTGALAFSAASCLFTFLLHHVAKDERSDMKNGKCGGESSKDCNDNNVGGSKKSPSSPANTLEDALIDCKVTAAIAKKSVCELQAKLCVISNRYNRLLSPISVKDRRLEVVPALQTCEEVLQLFHDGSHVFRTNPLVSSPFLVSFAGIFMSIAELSLVLIPSYKGPLVGEMNLLKDTLSAYKAECIKVRMDNIKFKGTSAGSMLDVVANGVPEMNYKMVDACLEKARGNTPTTPTPNSEVNEEEMENIYHNANEALLAYRTTLENEYEKFFEPVLDTILEFSGFVRSSNQMFSPGYTEDDEDDDVYE